MKKIITMLASLALLGALGTAAATPGSASDPLISRSYLDGEYRAAVLKEGKEAIDSRLRILYESYAARIGKGSFQMTAGAQPFAAPSSATVTLLTGGSFVLYEGSVRVTVKTGTVFDLSTGAAIESGTELLPYRRYFCVEDTEAVFTCLTAAAFTVDGPYQGSAGVRAQDTLAIPFFDVPSYEWYVQYVEFVSSRGIMIGTAPGEFAPEEPIERAHMMTLAARLSGYEPDQSAGPEWYSDARQWAMTNGVSDGTEPESTIKREDAVTMLYRLAQKVLGLDVSQRADISGFKDAYLVDDYAQDAMAWAVGVGLIEGHDTGELDPLGNATRAEIAKLVTVLMTDLMK